MGSMGEAKLLRQSLTLDTSTFIGSSIRARSVFKAHTGQYTLHAGKHVVVPVLVPVESVESTLAGHKPRQRTSLLFIVPVFDTDLAVRS